MDNLTLHWFYALCCDQKCKKMHDFLWSGHNDFAKSKLAETEEISFKKMKQITKDSVLSGLRRYKVGYGEAEH